MNKSETWLEVVARARRTLRPEQYREWQFIVGSDGTEAERCERGRRALAIMNRTYIGPTEFKVPTTGDGNVRMLTSTAVGCE